jgi:chromosome segregation ATPase
MKEITRIKKLEVAQYFLLGYSYDDMEGKTGVSHGSIVNIVKELEEGKLEVPGTPFDQINDLRQLSLDLKKKSLSTSQALLGLALFQRINTLDIPPELLNDWAQLAKKLTPAEFPAGEFLEAALRIYHLEETSGKPFEALAEEYGNLTQEIDKLSHQVNSLVENKKKLSGEATSLKAQLDALEKKRDQLNSSVEIQSEKLKEIKTRVEEAMKDKGALSKEIKELKVLRTKLSSEVDGKEESLARLAQIGLSDGDLLRLLNILSDMAKKDGLSMDQVKEAFFTTASQFASLFGLKKATQTETQVIEGLKNKEAILTGEIASLEEKSAFLQAEIVEKSSDAGKQIQDASGEAVAIIRQQADTIRSELDSIMADALAIGTTVVEMRANQQQGEGSVKELKAILTEVGVRLGEPK